MEVQPSLPGVGAAQPRVMKVFHKPPTRIGITEYSRRTASCEKPSRRWRSGTSPSGATPRPAGMIDELKSDEGTAGPSTSHTNGNGAGNHAGTLGRR
jgi:hypothetical protein